jgi:hypothetical protein
MTSRCEYPNAFAAWARKPAVEDFEGIETQQPEVIPQGTEALFNFDKDIAHQVGQKKAVIRNIEHIPVTRFEDQNTFPWAGVMGLLTLLALPLASWFSTTKKFYEKMPPVSSLEDFRKKESEKEEIKKAS